MNSLEKPLSFHLINLKNNNIILKKKSNKISITEIQRI